jgi:hypothetical protein
MIPSGAFATTDRSQALVLCAEINAVRVDRLYPRALLTPFTHNVSLTPADRKAYTGQAKLSVPRDSSISTLRFTLTTIDERGGFSPKSAVGAGVHTMLAFQLYTHDTRTGALNLFGLKPTPSAPRPTQSGQARHPRRERAHRPRHAARRGAATVWPVELLSPATKLTVIARTIAPNTRRHVGQQRLA